MDVDAKLTDLGLSLGQPPAAVANYLPAVRCDSMLVISGQLPLRDGRLIATGKVPTDVTLDAAREAAAQCVLNGLSLIRQAIDGDWAELVRIVRIGVFVQSTPDFTDQAKVANGASDLLVEIFGDAGKHARAAVGVNSLPLNAPVEIEMLAELR